MNHEIKTKKKAFTKQGTLAEKGFAKHFNFIYNRKDIKSFPFKLKEWDFYQFQKDPWVVQITMGHLSYIGQGCVNLLNIDTGKKYSISILRPLNPVDLDFDPEAPSYSELIEDNFKLRYRITESARIMDFEGSNHEYKDVALHLVAENDLKNEKMAIATPFEKPTQFYLNFKENYYTLKGYVRFDDVEVNFDDAVGVMDWGRGVWPYSHEWFWGSCSALVDNVPIGFNIGWGFGDLSHATENMLFYNKKAYKLGALHTEWDDADIMKEQHYYDKEHKLDFIFRPHFDHYSENKVLIVDTECHQVFGYCTGYAETDEGRIEFKDIPAFIEHAINNW